MPTVYDNSLTRLGQPVTADLAPPAAADFAHRMHVAQKWRRRNRYYYAQLERLFRRHVPPGGHVLEIGSGLGDLLAALRPARGVGIETDRRNIAFASRRFPDFEFVHANYESFDVDGEFDSIVVSNALTGTKDIQQVFTRARAACKRETRFVVAYFNALWEPVLNLASAVGLRQKLPAANWLSRHDVENLLDLAGFEVVTRSTELLFPKYLPGVSTLLNRLACHLWPFSHLALMMFFVARPRMAPARGKALTCSVIVPTHEERGNIGEVVRRTPKLGAGTELIFVDGGSTDGTAEEIQRHIDEAPPGTIRLIQRGGRFGKGDAVRAGFAAATGDVLMILDADLTVTPEDLPKFFDALASGRGELINGTRLVYPLADQAMRFINKCGNRFFSIAFSWLLGQRFRDTLCGTKAMLRTDHQRHIAPARESLGTLDPFGDFDLILGAARRNLKIVEIPVRYGARSYGTTSIRRFRDGWLLLRMTWLAFRRVKLG